jgi:hypothetical protein
MLCKIWDFHGSDYEECRLLGYKTAVRTSQETHYFSATESSELMLGKIWGFHCSDYEEWRLLGYKNPARTSHETHYISATELSLLMLCKIWIFHVGDYEECRLLGYTNPVRTAQETHYFSATEPSQLKLCKIWDFTAMTMKNVLCWDIRIHFILHRRHITSQLQRAVGYFHVRFEVFMAVTMQNVVFLDVTPCVSWKNILPRSSGWQESVN